jgi:hypothetical protein
MISLACDFDEGVSAELYGKAVGKHSCGKLRKW